MGRIMRARRAVPLLAAIAAALTLAACGGAGPKDQAAPIVLSYPYGESGPYLFADYDRVIAVAARSYVHVTIRADAATAADAGHDRVSAASGIIVDPAGYIVTASHIAVDPKYHAEIVTYDGRIHRGEILRVDRDRELALIKIPPVPGLVAARFNETGTLAVGDHAAAIGLARRVKGVVALGLVKEPRLTYPLEYNGYVLPNPIVMTMAAEPGFSGGPVFDENGELIGMVASYDYRVGRNFAYAVPVDDIAAYLREPIATN